MFLTQKMPHIGAKPVYHEDVGHHLALRRERLQAAIKIVVAVHRWDDDRQVGRAARAQRLESGLRHSGLVAIIELGPFIAHASGFDQIASVMG